MSYLDFDFPHTHMYDSDLREILARLKALTVQLNNFISLNTIKYANPIQWNITTQYEANTVVIDPNDGTAYLSIKPVPSGVALTNTDYWMPIFTLNLLSANQNITLRDDGTNVLATFTSVEGDWLIWNNTLYRVTQPINTNEAYVVGYNIERYTVEQFIHDYVNAINTMIDNVNGIIGDVNDLDTTYKDDLVGAINELVDALNGVSDEVINIANSQLYTLNVLQYGVKNDGVTDCSEIVQNLLDTYAPCALYFPCGRYMFESAIEMPEKCQLIGDNNNESVVPMHGIDGAGGTVFLINFENDSFITFRSGNVFKGILFYYPNIADDVTPTTKPFTLTWKKGLTTPIYGVKFQSLYFMNSWGCVECNTGHGDFIFNDIVAAPARYGIHLDWSGGTDIFTDIRMSYFYFTTVSSAYALFMQSNCEGIWLGYSDAFHCKALYFGNLNAGVTFNESQVYTNGLAYGSIYGLSIDGCNYGIYSNGTHPIGVVVTDMTANGVMYAIMCAGQKSSYFKLANCNFWSHARIRIQKTSELTITGCTFNNDNGEYAIEITDSSTKLIVTGCKFGAGVVPIRNIPASGTNTIIAKGNLADTYPINNLPIVGELYNDNHWSSGSRDIGNATAVSLAGENILLFNQANAITISEASGYAYPSGSEITIFNYGNASGSITVNGVTKTIAAKTCAKICKYASVWYVME